MPLLRSDIRASDTDREAVAEFLKRHYTAGRLTEDEFDARVDAAYAAVGLSQLDRLVGDLPAHPPAPPARRSSVRPVAACLTAAVLAVAVATVVPPEAWAMLLVLALPLLLFAGMALMMLAPVAIPVVLLVWLVHAMKRAAAPLPLNGGARQAPLRGSASRRRLG